MKLSNCRNNWRDHAKGAPAWLHHHYRPSRFPLLHIVQATGRERAEARAFDRFFKNRVKQLGTFLPPSPDAPEPDTALLWNFLSRQLAEGITNEADVLPRARVTSPGALAADFAKRGSDGRAGKAARSGVVIAHPRPFRDFMRAIPCPPLPGCSAASGDALDSHQQQQQQQQQQPGDPSSPPSNTLVHVFWDVESAHPGDRDPRLVAAEVQRLAARLGRVVGCYAYATRPAWAWVPSYFLAEYVDSSDDGDSDGDSDGGASPTVALLPGRVRCPVCGKPLTAARLERHIRTLHPDRPAASLAAAAAADASAAVANPEELAEQPRGANRAGTAAAGADRAGRSAAAAGGGRARKNSYRTGLGSVREYYSSNGELFRPPAGHQLGLKYVLQREGFEPRVVQNADGASDRAVNGGIDRLLAALRSGSRARGGGLLGSLAGGVGGSGGGGGGRAFQLDPAALLKPPSAAGELRHTLVLVSGSERHAAALRSCAQLGVRTVVVAAAAKAGSGGMADAVLPWDLLAVGAYRI